MSQEQDIKWYAPYEAPLRLSGFAWFEQDRIYRRLPVKPDWPIPDAVDQLANHTAGGQVAFRTDSRRVWVKVQLAGPANMVHMPATGQCGFDLYLGEPGSMMYWNTTKWDGKESAYTVELLNAPTSEMRHITINFPLYQGVKELHIGLDEGARVEAPAPYVRNERIIFYGTSITQGACATRPGLAYTNILSRRLNVEMINLGFSGSGKGEPELAHLAAQIERPACLVLDYEANCVSTELFRETLPQFIAIYRQYHPDVPILVISRLRRVHDEIYPDSLARRTERWELQRGTVEARRKAGDRNIYFLDGTTLLKSDWDECTVDTTHPNDIGFLQMADGIEPVLRVILGL